MERISRIKNVFMHDQARIAYLTAGDGGIERTLNAALALIEGGVNMLEIGIPFSDPVADGPIIQRASARSLAQGTTLKDVLFLIHAIRERSNIPLVLFSYLNPILAALPFGFLKQAKIAGIDALLLVDCPLEESEPIYEQCIQQDLSLIYIITPNTSITRMHKINHYARGFLYYACRKGTTGLSNALPDDFAEKIQTIKSNIALPVVVGFGISNQEMAAQVLEHADGVVVGSLFVKALEENIHPSELATIARKIFAQ